MKLIIKTAKDMKAEAKAKAEAEKRRTALAYLAESDWYVTRNAETGTPIPDEVLERRRDARAAASLGQGGPSKS